MFKFPRPRERRLIDEQTVHGISKTAYRDGWVLVRPAEPSWFWVTRIRDAYEVLLGKQVAVEYHDDREKREAKEFQKWQKIKKQK